MKGCSLALLILLVLASLGLWYCDRDWKGDNLPSEAALKAQFSRCRAHLVRLQQMATEDRLNSRIHADYVDDKTLPPQRLAEYRRRMKLAGITRLWGFGPGKRIEFLVDAVEMLDSGIYKGFVYSETEQGPTAKSLGETCMTASSRKDPCSAAQPLEPNWWVMRWEFR